MSDSGLDFTGDDEGATRAGVAVGSGIGGIISFQDNLDVMRQRGPDRISPFAIPQIISNMAAGLASISFNLLGPNTATVTACAASANAIGDGAEIIRRGGADVMVVGGAEAPVCEFAVAGFAQTRALSTRNDDPSGASRPFDADRDGFVIGEGAAVLILEERERALARGVRIYGEFLGYGMSADAYHMTLPRPGGMGAARAMQNALDDAGLDATDIGYINAHGTSTPANDSTETAAIKLVFGDYAARIPISSTKSMTGHLLGGAGALESLVCLLAIRDGVLPPTINYTTPDPECDLDYVPNEARNVEISRAMTNSFGFGGHNVALVFGSHD
jgi:beta-ketoacyl-acyl-carrier-protein synthase II